MNLAKFCLHGGLDLCKSCLHSLCLDETLFFYSEDIHPWPGSLCGRTWRPA